MAERRVDLMEWKAANAMAERRVEWMAGSKVVIMVE